MVWQQIYDPMNNMWISTLLAAIPVVVMLVGLGFFHLKAHIAAGAGLLAALLIGLVDTFGKVLLPQAAGVLVYVLMALILLWRPHGLFKD